MNIARNRSQHRGYVASPSGFCPIRGFLFLHAMYGGEEYPGVYKKNPEERGFIKKFPQGFFNRIVLHKF
jgi:hypothetical protein